MEPEHGHDPETQDGAIAATRVVVARDAHELRQHLAALEDLAAAALEPNVFYEPWALFPAVYAFGERSDLWFVLVYDDRTAESGGRLCGFFPFERGRRFAGVPVTVFRLWKYGTAYCGLCTPLIRNGAGRAVLSTLLAWTKDCPDGPALIEWQRFGGDGPIYKLLIDFLSTNGLIGLHVESRTRPLLCRRADAEEFLRLGYSARHRNTNRRKERRLAALGRLEFRELAEAGDASDWADQFIRLESAGWKAGQASALAATDASRGFFRSIIDRGWSRGKIMILEVRLDGALIGGMCNLVSAPGSFLYKVAFDERYSRNSPGELLQQENIRRVHARPDILWMDSLAEPSFEHVYRWLDRRTIQSVVWSTGRARGDLALSMLPAVAWVKRRMSRHGSTA